MDVTDRIGCVLTAAGAFFRVWAPHAAAVSVAVQDGQEWVGGPGVTHALKRAADDYWSATVPGVAPGQLYRFRIITDGGVVLERLDAAAASVRRIRDAARHLQPGDSPEDLAPLRDAFFDALADDFNTAEALARVFDWIREANRREGPVGDAQLREMLEVRALDNLLEADAGPPDEIVELARRRTEARAAKDFAEADRLRDEVRAAGWEIRDGPDGPELVPAG